MTCFNYNCFNLNRMGAGKGILLRGKPRYVQGVGKGILLRGDLVVNCAGEGILLRGNLIVGAGILLRGDLIVSFNGAGKGVLGTRARRRASRLGLNVNHAEVESLSTIRRGGIG